MQRRRFLISTLVGAGSTWLGCGSDTSSGSGGGLMTATSSATTGTGNHPIGSTVTTIELTSSVGGTLLPFTVGQAFRKGDVPADAYLVTDVAEAQAEVKNRWPDGSVKFAIVSGRATLTAGTPRAIALKSANTAPSSSPALTTSDLRSTSVTASIGFGPAIASWADADWDNPFQSWVTGNEMSSWIYRKSVGTDAHLVAWLEVRLFAGGAVEVLPWVENGYLLVAGPTNKSATYTFTLGGVKGFSAAIDLPHHCRTPLIGGAALSYWLGADPAIVPRHDVQYLQATELVPSYWSVVPASAQVVLDLPATYTPLQAGSFVYDGDSMASSGFQSPIGLLPQHDVLYLTCDSPKVYEAVLRNGYCAGRYAIHYRDEATNRPLRFTSHPTLVISDGSSFKDNGSSTKSTITPKVGGTAPPSWDVAHSPSVGYMAYLVTGRWYFMEEVQFAATANYLGKSDNTAMRTGSLALVQTASGAWQTRACAWDWRSLVHALCVTPDDDSALRDELKTAVENNVNWFHTRYIVQPANMFGWIMPGEAYNNSNAIGAPWQQDFVTAVFGWALAMDLPISPAAATKLAAFFAWKAKSAVGRLGTSSPTDWWYINAFPYNMSISPSMAPDYMSGAGPWHSSWREAYDATYASPPAWLGSTEGVLAFEYIDSPTIGMFANFLPAIAYAVRHEVPGAIEGYTRMISASNWSTLAAAFERSPIWAVTPASK